MRTRFLATDYFFNKSATETFVGFNFVPLPSPPDLFPSDPRFDLAIPFFEVDLDLSLKSEIDEFPIENALYDLLSDVLPSFQHPGEIDAGAVGSRVRNSLFREEITDLIHEEKEEDTSLSLRSDASATNRAPEGGQLEQLLQFEIVEVELPLDETLSSCEAEEGSSGVFFEIPAIKLQMDVIDIGVEITVPYPHMIAKSICLVENYPARLNDELKYYSIKDSILSADVALRCAVHVPQFEITGDAWEIDNSMSGVEIFKFLLPIVEPWHGPQGEELMVNLKEFLVSDYMNISADHLGDVPYEFRGDEPISMMSVLDRDLINFNDNLLLEESSKIYPIRPDGTCSDLPCSVILQEVQIIDFPSDDVFEKFVNFQTANTCMSDQMLDDMELMGSLYDSIVSSELALVDETFKSLPTPVLSDDEAIKSQNTIIQDMLCAQKSHPLSACDGIYLDWHLLLEGTCNQSICSMYVSMVEEVNISGVNSELQIDFEQIVITNFDFLDDFRESGSMACREEVPSKLHIDAPQAHRPSAKEVIAQKQNNGNKSANSKEQLATMTSEKVSSLFESMSQSNDLNFFLDVRRGSTRSSARANEGSRKGSCKVSTPFILIEETSVPCVAPRVNPGQWALDIQIHQLILSDNIVSLLDQIYGRYKALLDEGTYLRKLCPVEELPNISKQKLLELIVTENGRASDSGHKDEGIMEIIAVYGIKQVAYFLCFFGVHTAHLYISNLTRNIDMLGRLRSIDSLIEDACANVEKQLIESHPSLSYIEKILRTNSQLGQKILIIAERPFWVPLSQKLSSMKIKYHELRHAHLPTMQFNTLENICFTDSVLEEMLKSDCLLMDFESDIPASFPFNKFNIVLEYGGQYSSSRLSSLAPNSDDFPPVHFFYVKMDVQNFHAALFEGHGVPQNWKTGLGAFSYSMGNLHESASGKNIIEALTYVPTSDRNSCISSESGKRLEASSANDSGANFPYIVKSNKINSSRPSFPGLIIIVNTQNFEKKMVISRRTSYQKILALEKGGAQVVEREVDLPVDLIFSAAVCLVWYEARTFGDKVDNTGMRAGTSSIPMFMEHIATNVLMSLSFSFSGCILIFEGESNSLAAVMEFSDALYAAAAGLDMNLQLFCSYTPESTDEIILGCIRNVTTLTRGLYPPMPEVETLGESFLTRFPSINPLSAHAILSSGGTLVEFLEWSHECRIQAVGKYLLSDESISLFSVLCRFGEMGESKSVMTECSSIGSDISSALAQSPRKRKKSASHTVAMPIGDPSYPEPLYQLSDNGIEQPPVFLAHHLRTSSSIQDKSRKTEGCIYDQLLGGGLRVNSRLNYGDGNDIVKDNFVNEEFGDGGIHHDYSLNEKRGSTPDTSGFSWVFDSRTKLPLRRSVPSSRLEFSGFSQRTFPTSADINHDMNGWNPLKDKDLSWDDKIFGEVALSSTKNDTSIMHREYLRDNIAQGYTNSLGYSSQNLPPLYRKDSYHNANLEQGPGPSWKKDFFSGINEKGRAHQKNLKGNTSLNSAIRSRNKDTNRKSQSPSIIDSYRYQGESQVSKVRKQTRRKDTKGQPSPDCKKRKNPSFNNPTWTPIDKRARQNLSFARYGNEKQSKLVWRNKSSPGTGGNLRKRYREEGQLNIL